MTTDRPVGLYGKLPSHGDFIHRNLPSHFINAWDTWLQSYMASIREQMGEDWLDLYLTSPIWRFALSPGVIDQHGWAGIMLPSVDRVGRYFPFSIAKPLAQQCNPFALITQLSWFEALENAALLALSGRCAVDQLAEDINEPVLDGHNPYSIADAKVTGTSAIIELEEEAQSLSQSFPCLLDSMVRTNSPSYSVWASQGSERVEPCLFHCPALPRMTGVVAMLDGRWQEWGWPRPYQLLNSPHEAVIQAGTD